MAFWWQSDYCDKLKFIHTRSLSAVVTDKGDYIIVQLPAGPSLFVCLPHIVQVNRVESTEHRLPCYQRVCSYARCQPNHPPPELHRGPRKNLIKYGTHLHPQIVTVSAWMRRCSWTSNQHDQIIISSPDTGLTKLITLRWVFLCTTTHESLECYTTYSLQISFGLL